jgi:WD40 repeat protein/serine/threonine protein kinase
MSEFSSSSDSERDPVEALADEFLERLRRGERPALTEYTRKYPQWADRIRKVLPALVVMEGARPETGDGGGADAEERRPERLGDYRILREVGRGGMGIVYEAEQESLGRHVALKVLPAHALLDPKHLQRFRREAKAAARLHHTNIVPVFGVGEERAGGVNPPVHYYVMQFIQGLGLDEVLEEVKRLRGQPVAAGPGPAADAAQSLLTGTFAASRERERPESSQTPVAHAPGSPGSSSSQLADQTQAAYPRAVARLGVQVAEALAYAHAQGILHRDIKPANLLLDAAGTAWVTDFGLAKAADSEDLTHTGDIIGTLRYMAPERFQGRADARSDVYALGLTLYELLTLRPAFDEGDRNKLVAQVMHGEPPRPRQVSPDVPRDLETVVLKVLERDPSRRYPSAGELAADLRRFLSGEPIRARRVNAWERGWRWCRRNPAAAALVAVTGVAVLLSVGSAVGLWYHGKTQAALEQAQFHQYFHHIARAQAGWQNEMMAQVEKLLDDCASGRRGWEWYYLKRLCHADLLTLRGHTGAIWGVAYSPDGTRLATASPDGTVKLWDAITGQEVRTLKGHTSPVFSVAFSPDGTRLASGDEDSIVIWDVTDGRVIHPLIGHKGRVLSLAFGPDGTRLASASYDQTVKIWNVRTGRLLDTLQGHAGGILGVAFSPDGTQIASAGYYAGVVEVWDARTGKVLHTLRRHAGRCISVGFSPDGTRIASASSDGAVKVWDVAIGREVLTFKGHRSSVQRVAFSPDGTRLASASADGAVKVWDVATGQLTRTFLGHTSEVRGLAFSPDGTRLASASADQTVKVWGMGAGHEPRVLTGHTHGLLGVAFSPDGSRLASASRDMTVKVWNVATGQVIWTLTGHTGGVWGVAFSPDGTRIASSGGDRDVRLWDTTTGQEVSFSPLRGHRGQVDCVVFSPDGTQLASACGDGTVKLWDATTGREIRTLRGHTDGVRGVAFSPDGTQLASAGRDYTVRVWEAATGHPIRTLHGHTNWVKGLAFSPDGSRLASASYDNTVRVWDAATGAEVLPPLTGHTSIVFSVAFSPDGTRLASSGMDGTVKVWDAATGQEVLTLKGHGDEVQGVAFSPDGTLLASASEDGTVRIWDARPLASEVAGEREALALLDYLFAKPLRKSDVLDYLHSPSTMTPEARGMALTFVKHYREETDPEKYHRASWAVVRQPYLNAFQYRFALRQAEAACALAAERGRYLTALGAAQCLAGPYPGALEALARADRLNRRLPAYLACLALAQHRLGQTEQARATLARSREANSKSAWARDGETQTVLREAAALIEAGPAVPQK